MWGLFSTCCFSAVVCCHFEVKHAVVLRPATANPHNQNKKQPMRSSPDWVWFYLWPVDKMAWDFLPVAKCNNVKSKQFSETLLPIVLKAAVTTGEQRKSSTVFSTLKRKRIRLLQAYRGLARILGGSGQRHFVNSKIYPNFWDAFVVPTTMHVMCAA